MKVTPPLEWVIYPLKAIKVREIKLKESDFRDEWFDE